jgi:hypothetical protein
VYLPLRQPLHQAAQLYVDNLLHVVAPKCMEENNLIDTIEELRPEVGAQRLHHLAPRAFA